MSQEDEKVKGKNGKVKGKKKEKEMKEKGKEMKGERKGTPKLLLEDAGGRWFIAGKSALLAKALSF